jgi:hypothetical protein
MTVVMLENNGYDVREQRLWLTSGAPVIHGRESKDGVLRIILSKETGYVLLICEHNRNSRAGSQLNNATTV